MTLEALLQAWGPLGLQSLTVAILAYMAAELRQVRRVIEDHETRIRKLERKTPWRNQKAAPHPAESKKASGLPLAGG